MSNYEAPHVNGVMDLTEGQVLSIQTKLQSIVDGFQPSYEQPACDTFYLVVKYIQTHSEDTDFILINGDTAEYCLGFTPSEVE